MNSKTEIRLSMPPGYLTYRGYTDKTLRISPCNLGFGVFANKPFAEGERILTFKGRNISFRDTKKKGEWECMPIQIGTGAYIDTLPLGVFVNHSCNPNAGIRDDFYLIALSSIEKDEEIRFDYSTTMQESSFTMECRCGSNRCRGIVDDFNTLPEATRYKYLEDGIVMGFIAQRYSELNGKLPD